MPFITRRLLPAATLLIAFTTAQTCYYPNGHISSNDLPCSSSSAGSACCGADSFCLAGGLCYSGGLVIRGSCTDKTWGSADCAGYCRNVQTSGEIAISPCTSNQGSNEFVCGVNTTDCQTGTNTFTLSGDASIVLRPNQIAQLVGTALATAVPSSAASGNSANGLSTGAVAGVAVGIAVPLLIALGIMYLLLRREQHRFSKPKLMYKLPDEVTKEDFTFTPPPPIRTTTAFSSRRSSMTSRGTVAGTIASGRGSIRTATTASTQRPAAPPTFLERYNAMKSIADAQVASKGHSSEYSMPMSPRHELASPTPADDSRYELSSTRMSQD